MSSARAQRLLNSKVLVKKEFIRHARFTGMLFLVAFLITLTGCSRSIEVFVDTPSGRLKGFESDHVQKFLGIRYAQPPVGALRWKPPVPITQWNGILDAEDFGPWCSQFDFERRDEGKVHAGEGWTIFQNVPQNESSNEDCLSLNVFAPPKDGTSRPVMVFLHGNALGNSFPMYDGTDVAKGGIVYVSINYRLHSLGIFAHPALTAEAQPDAPLGRYSELDRLAALRWVQRNIAAFGGDPTQVTLAGHSEGGAAILQMLGNPSAEGLFQRAIVQSGNGWWEPVGHQQHEELGCYLAELAGLEGCDATAEELRNLERGAIPASGPYTIDERYGGIGATEAIESTHVMDIPILIGWNDFDGSSLRYSPQEVVDHTHPAVLASYDTEKPLEDLAYDIYTDQHSGAPARWVAHQLEEGEPVYLYLYSYVVSWDRGDVRGAEHGYELPHALNSFEEQLDGMFPFLSNVLLDDEDRAMTQIMHQCWLSFVKTGKPSCPSAPDWPAYSRTTDQLMELNLEPRVVTGYRASQLDAQEMYRHHYFEQVKESMRRLLVEGI